MTKTYKIAVNVSVPSLRRTSNMYSDKSPFILRFFLCCAIPTQPHIIRVNVLILS